MKNYDEMEALLENLEQMQWDLKNIRETISAGDVLLSEISHMGEVLRNFNNWCDEGWIEETIVQMDKNEEDEMPAYMLEKKILYDIDDTVHRVKDSFQKFKSELRDMGKALASEKEPNWLQLEDDFEWVEQYKEEIYSEKVQNMIARIMEIICGLKFKLRELIELDRRVRKDNNIVMSNLFSQEYIVF